MDQINDVIEVIEELCEDTTIPRNIKTKFQEIISALKDDSETSIKVNKALHNLDEIGDDSNLQPYIRTQIWNIVSILESIQNS